jgi:ferritin-like protein
MTGLADALSAEYAAIYGYGIVGAHLTGANQDAARQAEAAHRSRRDALLVRMAAASATPPAADPAYTLPYAVTDRDTALKLAVDLEDGAARAWYGAIGATSGDDRSLAANALIDCSVRATRWRKLAGTTPATLTFPGTRT